jgi:hypothetical protein
MSQHDFEIANQTASSARDDINQALVALASNNSGPTAPTTTKANMWWYDTTNDILKFRNNASLPGTAWIDVAYLDQSTSKFKILDDTAVVDTNGNPTGLLGGQATGTWTTGTGTTESLVSPAQVASSVASNIPDTLGVGQTWQDMSASRAINTSYQNTTGRPIMVSVCTRSSVRYNFEVSTNNTTFVSVGAVAGFGNLGDEKSAQVIVPDDHYYRVTGGSLIMWAELR